MFPFFPKKYISHAIIVVMIFVSILGFTLPRFHILFGYSLDLMTFDPFSALSQITLFQFLHGGIIHLLFNAYFLYQAGPEVEERMSRNHFIEFFVGSTLFVALCLSIFSSGITIGMSGFCMALLSYLWIDLATARHPMANQILIMLILNIAIGLSGSISFTAHAAGAVFGLFWWKFMKRK